jgi:Zn-finger nucleic acid-binding protein
MKGDQAPCPACRSPLQRASSRWDVLACLACGGVWTDSAASRRITATVDRELVTIAKEAAKLAKETDSTYERMSDVELHTGRVCPICAGVLACVRSGHVAIDVCAEHGTWFDKDELGRLSRNLEFERVSAAPVAPPTGPYRQASPPGMPASAPPNPSEEPPAMSRNAEMLLSILGRGD